MFKTVKRTTPHGIQKDEDTRTHEHIVIDPEIMFGKPVIRGTRITVESILRIPQGFIQIWYDMAAEDIILTNPA